MAKYNPQGDRISPGDKERQRVNKLLKDAGVKGQEVPGNFDRAPTQEERHKSENPDYAGSSERGKRTRKWREMSILEETSSDLHVSSYLIEQKKGVGLAKRERIWEDVNEFCEYFETSIQKLQGFTTDPVVEIQLTHFDPDSFISRMLAKRYLEHLGVKPTNTTGIEKTSALTPRLILDAKQINDNDFVIDHHMDYSPGEGVLEISKTRKEGEKDGWPVCTAQILKLILDVKRISRPQDDYLSKVAALTDFGPTAAYYLVQKRLINKDNVLEAVKIGNMTSAALNSGVSHKYLESVLMEMAIKFPGYKYSGIKTLNPVLKEICDITELDLKIIKDLGKGEDRIYIAIEDEQESRKAGHIANHLARDYKPWVLSYADKTNGLLDTIAKEKGSKQVIVTENLGREDKVAVSGRGMTLEDFSGIIGKETEDRHPGQEVFADVSNKSLIEDNARKNGFTIYRLGGELLKGPYFIIEKVK